MDTHPLTPALPSESSFRRVSALGVIGVLAVLVALGFFGGRRLATGVDQLLVQLSISSARPLLDYLYRDLLRDAAVGDWDTALASFQTKLEATSVEGGSEAVLLDRDGRVLAHVNRTRVGADWGADELVSFGGKGAVSALELAALESSREGYYETARPGGPYVAVARGLPDKRGLLLVLRSKEELDLLPAPLRKRAGLVFLGTLAWAIVSGLLTTHFLASRFYKPAVVQTRRLAAEALTDPLTELFNRRYVFQLLQKEMDRSRRYNGRLCVAMIDIDHFKRVNDTFGHLAGDHVLMEVARILKDALRASDSVHRYGGEEFCLTLPEQRTSGALAILERIRTQIETHPFVYEGHEIEVTVSCGAAFYPDSRITTQEELIQAADSALYEAKRTGRNKTILWEDLEEAEPKGDATG